jgi:hypothetical protein
MTNKNVLSSMSKEELIELLGIYAKNWLALDGVWFQSIERKRGMAEAVFHDIEAWRRFAAIEAGRIKEFLKLPDQPGLTGLAKALELRFNASFNEYEIIWQEDKLIFRNVECRVQTARKRRNLPYHPCKPVGLVEHAEFAKAIDERIRCRCLSCYPEVTDETVCCSWEFSI